MTGLLSGLRVIEVASEHAAFAGKLMAGLGAEVLVLEPPGGHRSRGFGPFVDDEADPERSLWWWHYNTSKLGITLDLNLLEDAERFRQLVGTADIVLEGEPLGALDARGLGYEDLRAVNPNVVWVSVTPFGREMPRRSEQSIDLTVLASGGPVWSSGYDDHRLPPVRGGGNQGYQMGAIWAVIGALTALLHRDRSGQGQLVDTSLHAAANVTTELATYEWLVRRATVQRQTCRHASVDESAPVLADAADGRAVTTGVPPRETRDFRAVLDWLDELGIRDEFDDALFLELGVERGILDLAQLGIDAEITAIYGAGRDALQLIASKLCAYDFFVGAESRGLTCAVLNTPEEMMEDPHFVARGFPVSIEHEDIGRSVRYPGAAFVLSDAEWTFTRAPHVGEHNELVLGSLDESS